MCRQGVVAAFDHGNGTIVEDVTRCPYVIAWEPNLRVAVGQRVSFEAGVPGLHAFVAVNIQRLE